MAEVDCPERPRATVGLTLGRRRHRQGAHSADGPGGAKSGRYNVTVKDSKGVRVGDGNIQVNKF